MKSKTFRLSHNEALMGCIAFISDCEINGSLEVVIRDAKISKTLAQLGGLFGCWIKYLSAERHRSENYWHRKLKAEFLARIYCMEPIGDEQEQWVELLYVYQESQQQEKLLTHAARISLSWATIKQMTDYMNAVENHFIDEGMPLPILDKFEKYYR